MLRQETFVDFAIAVAAGVGMALICFRLRAREGQSLAARTRLTALAVVGGLIALGAVALVVYELATGSFHWTAP